MQQSSLLEAIGGKVGLQETACEDDWASLNPNVHTLAAWLTKAMESLRRSSGVEIVLGVVARATWHCPVADIISC